MAIDIVWLGSQFPDLSQLAPLSKGGQKLVFSAKHTTYGDVVLKLVSPIQPVADSDREILAVRQILSPRVPKILLNGQIATPLGDSFWLLEQRIMGKTVRELIPAGPLDWRQCLRLGLHMLEALVKAEDSRIVHRDVKPDNIICDLQGNFWLLDFGLARHLRLESLTATSLPFGKVTFGYSPPEQCRNIKREIDSRSDLFALGITLYECAIGINPFRNGATTELEMLKRVETMPLPPLNLVFSSAIAFRDLIATMTQKRRDHRPPSAKYALDWIQDICRIEKI